MEITQVKQLKLNVSNINSFLKNSNKNYNALRKSNQRIASQQFKQDKLKLRERSVEKKPTLSSPLKTVKDVAKSSMGMFDKILNFGGILLTGILFNALPSIKAKVDEFRKDNKELIDNVVSGLTVVKDFAANIFNSFTGPYAEEGSLDWLGKFDDSGVLQSGVLKEIERTFDKLGGMINDIDKALGGEGKIGNVIITGQRVLAKKDGKTGVKNTVTGEFTERAFTPEEQQRYDRVQSGGPPVVTPIEPSGNAESATPINDTSSGGRRDDHSETVVRTPGAGKGVPFSANKPMQQIYLHWAGTPYNVVSDVYNAIAKGDGTLVRNHAYGKRGLGHTYGRNSKGVGLSIAAMGVKGGSWSEKRAWKEFPPTNAQLNAMTAEAARIAIAWGWKKSDINKSKILTHAEAAIQDGYGPGSGDSQMRWDYHYMKPGGKWGSGGEILRNMIKKHYDLMKPTTTNLQASATVVPQAQLSGSSNNNRLASLNTTIGEDGSTTFIYAVQPVIT